MELVLLLQRGDLSSSLSHSQEHEKGNKLTKLGSAKNFPFAVGLAVWHSTQISTQIFPLAPGAEIQQCCLQALLHEGFTKNPLTERENSKIQGILKCYVPKCKEGPMHSAISFQQTPDTPSISINFSRGIGTGNHSILESWTSLLLPPAIALCRLHLRWQLPPLLSGYWLHAGMSHWGFIFPSVSLFISPFSSPFEANQAASTSAQRGRVHLCTAVRS